MFQLLYRIPGELTLFETDSHAEVTSEVVRAEAAGAKILSLQYVHPDAHALYFLGLHPQA